MTLRPPHPHARPWRWLATALALLVLATVYWIALERIAVRPGIDHEPARRAPQGLDRHMPRVD